MSNNGFNLANGRVLTNLEELAEVIGTMSDEEFNVHVNAEKNDFSIWVNDVFQEHLLAQKLLVAKNKEDMSVALEDYFADMAKKLSKEVLKNSSLENPANLVDSMMAKEQESIKGVNEDKPKKQGFFSKLFSKLRGK